MTAVRETVPRFTPEEYFAWEEQQLCRHEYFDGDVYAMSDCTIKHSEIAVNIGVLLKTHLRGCGHKTLNSDARVNILASNNYVYPDVSVTCDDRDKSTAQYITYPCLIVEVLSPGTESYDRGKKFRLYRKNPNLQDYVLVDSESIAIEVFRKSDNNSWQILNYQAGDLVELTSVGLTFPIEQVYEDIIFNDTTSDG
jgi:Uma2 family endonuclease